MNSGVTAGGLNALVGARTILTPARPGVNAWAPVGLAPVEKWVEPSIVPIQVPKIDGSLALFLAVTESACLRSANHWAVDMKTLDTYNSRVAFAQSGIPGVGCSLGSRDAGDLKKQ